jgi:hypothetical protein
MPQNYNGTTSIGAGATLQLGNGAPVQALKATVGAPTAGEPFGAVTGTAIVATYTGDSSLLTAESATGAATDNIVNDGHLIVNNTTTTITLSHMSGSGTFMQAGPADVTILANTYRGGTFIRGGTLFAADDSALGSGDVSNAARLAAARRQRVIHVQGNYHQSESATLELKVLGPGKSERLEVAGHAELAGTLLLSGATLAHAKAGQRLAVVRASAGIRGKFSSVVAPGFELRVSYDARNCYVSVVEPRIVRAGRAINPA